MPHRMDKQMLAFVLAILSMVVLLAVSFMPRFWPATDEEVKSGSIVPDASFKDKLQERVSYARVKANLSLALIGTAIILGLILFLTASKIDEIAGLDQLRDEVRESNTPLYDLSDVLRRHERIKERNGVLYYEMDTSLVFKDSVLANVLGKLSDNLAAHSELQSKITSEMKDPPETLIGYNLLAATLVRVGVIILLIYTSQILLRLYRYHTRMANYYQAIIDAMIQRQLIGVESMHEAFELLHPKVDVGVGPRSPLDGAGKVMQNVKWSPTIET